MRRRVHFAITHRLHMVCFQAKTDIFLKRIFLNVHLLKPQMAAENIIQVFRTAFFSNLHNNT